MYFVWVTDFVVVLVRYERYFYKIDVIIYSFYVSVLPTLFRKDEFGIELIK